MVLASFISKERALGGARQALEMGPKGWLCSEGDRIILCATGTVLPDLRSAGMSLPHRSLTHVAGVFSAEYELLIDSWAGRMVLDLCAGGAVCEQLRLDIRPSERKLQGDEFEAMLDELSLRSPALLWGLSRGAMSGKESRDAPAVVHPIVVDALLPQFERLLRRFLLDPPTRSVRTRDLRPFDLSRRADVATMRWLGRRPTLLATLRGQGPSGAAPDRTPIDQPVTLQSLDHPVTRYFAHLAKRVSERFLDSAARLRMRQGMFVDPVADAHAESLAQRLEASAQRLGAVLQHPVFRQASREPPSETAIQAIADHPLFSALQRVGRRLLEPGLAYDPGGDLEAALKRTYDLFELVVLYRLVDELAASLGAGWKLRASKVLPTSRREERPENRASWWFEGPDKQTVELRYQQWFSRAKMVGDLRSFSSLSGPNLPDYILVHRRFGRVVSWVILDAKYRASRQPVDQGLGDIHRYRDALRVRGEAANGAFIIVPRLAEATAIYAQQPYLEAYRFGVLELFKAGWCAPILSALFGEPASSGMSV